METIVIFRIGSLGDTVVALPCFHRIEKSYSAARRVLVTDIPASQKAAPVESVLRGSGLIHDVIYFPPAPRKLRDFAELYGKLRGTGAKILIYIADRHDAPHPVRTTIRDVAFFRFCGIKEIIGASVARRLRRLRIDPLTGYTEREAERLTRCLAALGPIDLDNPANWDLRLQPNESAAAERALLSLRKQEFIAVNMGGKVPAKDWGDQNWNALLAHMAHGLSHLALVFFGSGDEFERSANLAANWPGTSLNLCGRLTPRESAAAMSRARLFLGHDSGPMHLAAATGIPCIGMFGNANMPKWWHPIGLQHRIIHNMKGMRAIAPQDVYNVLLSLLSEERAQAPRLCAGA